MKEQMPEPTLIQTQQRYHKLREENLLLPHPLIIDGTDGSGKGTLAKELSKMLNEAGINTLSIDYPMYDLPWGKVVRKALDNPDKYSDLNIEERMALYALNRLESIPYIYKAIDDLATTSEQPILMLFDRFTTSNVLTAAFFLSSELTENATNEEIDNQIKQTLAPDRFLEIMNKIDAAFLELLGIKDFKVFMPRISHEESMKRLQKDNKRASLDSYEVPIVQRIANIYYGLLKDTITQVDQQDRVPQEIATEILNGFLASDYGISLRGLLNSDRKFTPGQNIILKESLGKEASDITIGAVNKLLDQYPKLKRYATEAA